MAATENDPYLTEGIIAYLGNKRRLLGLIGEAVARAAGRPADRLDGLRFADLFSGSGVVSRFARFRGMEVSANDWEPYARVLSRAWLEPRPEDIADLFGSPGGLTDAVGELNALPAPREADTYLAKYFAPASEDNDRADYRTERLFYTRANALSLDAARNHLEKTAPPPAAGDDRADLRRCMLLAPLIYSAATNVNTSGVFKACHRGFGGHGRDALGRITAPMVFSAPRVIDAPAGHTFSMDAAELAGSGRINDVDIAYLDPPYNQHQYGSNYHMLNTIVRWDRIPEPMDLGDDGRLLRKAAIRPDWKETRSSYCSRRTAPDAFGELLDALKAPMLLVSYSTDGIIPFDRLRDICESYGRLTLLANPYVTYRGGRQSAGRRDRNLEFLLILEKGKRTRRSDRDELDSVILRRRLQLALNDFYRPEVLQSSGIVEEGSWRPELPGGRISLGHRHLARLQDSPDTDELSARDLKHLLELLDEARCRGRAEELSVIEAVWRENPGRCRDLLKQAPRLLRKLAHRKYRVEYENHLERLKDLGNRHADDFLLISGELARVEEVARSRFAG